MVLLASIILVGLTITAIALLIRLRRYKRDLEAAEQQIERNQDEIWELKSAAAALDKAEAASEAKSRFLATVSHEFRTPLNGILGLAELMTSTALTAEQASYISAIRASGDALSSLINEILDFSRLEAGILELDPVEFDLPGLIEGVVELLSPRAQDKGLEICSIVDRTLPRNIFGDPGRLRQVLLNLIGNAVKFTERGGVAVEVSLCGAEHLLFSVIDTGPGISASRRVAVFQDFEQGDASTTRKHEGTGLGLAISRRIVEHFGGKLWLERSGSEGSQFCFEIPLCRATSDGSRESEKLDGRILIVGDSTFANRFLARRLIELGGTTTIVESYERAKEIVTQESTSPTILIVDCSLGEKATNQLSHMAKESGRRSILLFSPFERRAFGESILGNFDGWLVKPVRLESIGAKLGYLTNRDQANPVKAEAETSHVNLVGKHILLAEDNDVNALLVEKQLQKLGAEVSRARDGAEVVALVKSSFAHATRIDAILMDLQMPELDGLSASKQIRAIENGDGRKSIPIIALTANAFDEDRQAAVGVGMQGFLTKPIDLATLTRTLSTITQGAALTLS